MKHSTYDAVIIGAGPAGSTLARLMPSGQRLLLINGSAGRPKPCGGLLAPDAQKALARFDLALPKDVLVDPQIFSVKTIDVPSGLVRHYPRMYLNVDRARFDAWLLSLVPDNVEVAKARCTSVERMGGMYRILLNAGDVLEEIFAPVVIGADGAGSIVQRCLYPKLKTRRYVAIQQYFREDSQHSDPFYSCIFDPAATDCCSWSISKDGFLILGGAFLPQGSRAAFEAHKARLSPFGFRLDEPVRTEACLVLRPTGLRSFQTGRGGAYLVGEAAGFISPSSLEGISSAILSAVKLADALRTSDPAAAYRRKTFGMKTRLLLKNLKVPFMYHPLLRRMVLRSGITSIHVTRQG